MSRAFVSEPGASTLVRSSEESARNTADVYNRFGLPEYYAIEGFVLWRGTPI